jgi:hypothetical protein
MNPLPVAGTFRLDGMIQGPLPSDPAVIGNLQAWVVAAKASGLHFHFGLDAPYFSIVADPSVHPTAKLAGPDLAELLSDALNALMDLLPNPNPGNCFSTVRAEEFRPGIAIQTIFVLAADGRIASESRTVSSQTKGAPNKLALAVIRRTAMWALAVILPLLLVSSFFIDYRGLFARAADRMLPPGKENISVSQAALGEFVTVELTGLDRRRGTLGFKLKRGAKWDQALSSTPQQSLASWPEYLIHLAIHQRRLRIELYDQAGNHFGGGEISLDGLHQSSSADVEISAALPTRLAKIVIQP